MCGKCLTRSDPYLNYINLLDVIFHTKAYDQPAHQILKEETEKHSNLTSSIGAELTIIDTETLW